MFAEHRGPTRDGSVADMVGPGSLSALLPLRAIRLRQSARDWRDAVRRAGEALTASGAASPAYADEMIATVEQLGPYIVIAPGIALAHSRPSPAVLRTGLAWVTLARPVRFGHPENDPVSLVVGLAAVDDGAHVEALATLAELLSDDVRRAELLDAPDAAGVRAIVTAYEHATATAAAGGTATATTSAPAAATAGAIAAAAAIAPDMASPGGRTQIRQEGEVEA